MQKNHYWNENPAYEPVCEDAPVLRAMVDALVESAQYDFTFGPWRKGDFPTHILRDERVSEHAMLYTSVPARGAFAECATGGYVVAEVARWRAKGRDKGYWSVMARYNFPSLSSTGFSYDACPKPELLAQVSRDILRYAIQIGMIRRPYVPKHLRAA